MTGVRVLSAEDIWRLHVRVAAQANRIGLPFRTALRDPGLLESAANQPRQTCGGADLYPTVFEKAAALARGIICNHVSLDGNKRTGLAAAGRFLAYNGWDYSPPDHELVRLGLDIAGAREQGKEPLPVIDIAERLQAFSRPKPR